MILSVTLSIHRRAHFEAYTLRGILHRDISVGNIMINARTNEGLLTDWDLSEYVEKLNTEAVQPGGRPVRTPILHAAVKPD